LALLEEIREQALAKVFVKMQAHIRKIFVKITFDQKAKEKAALSSIQRSIKIYYRVRDWPWMQFYQLVLGETSNIKKKQEEAERRKKMQEGMDKIKEVVCAAVLAREDVEKANEKKKRELRKVIAEHAYQLEMSGSIMHEIVGMQEEVAEFEARAAAAEAKLEEQRQHTKKETQDIDGAMELQKITVRDKMAETASKMIDAENKAQQLILMAVHGEKQNVNLKMEIKAMKEEIERIQGTHSRHLREKNEKWAICSEMRERTHIENQATLNYRSYCKPVLPKQYV